MTQKHHWTYHTNRVSYIEIFGFCGVYEHRASMILVVLDHKFHAWLDRETVHDPWNIFMVGRDKPPYPTTVYITPWLADIEKGWNRPS